MDTDRVLLLEQGKLLEYGNPRELLDDPSSHFSVFVKGGQVSEENNHVDDNPTAV